MQCQGIGATDNIGFTKKKGFLRKKGDFLIHHTHTNTFTLKTLLKQKRDKFEREFTWVVDMSESERSKAKNKEKFCRISD